MYSYKVVLLWGVSWEMDQSYIYIVRRGGVGLEDEVSGWVVRRFPVQKSFQ